MLAKLERGINAWLAGLSATAFALCSTVFMVKTLSFLAGLPGIPIGAGGGSTTDRKYDPGDGACPTPRAHIIIIAPPLRLAGGALSSRPSLPLTAAARCGTVSKKKGSGNASERQCLTCRPPQLR